MEKITIEKIVKLYPKVILDIFKRNYYYYKSIIFRRKMVGNDYLNTFKLMSKDNNLQSSKHWEKLANNMKKEIIGKGLTNFKRGYCNNHFAGRYPKTVLEVSAVWQYYNNIKQRDKFNILNKISEPKIGNPYVIHINGKELMWDFLQGVDEFYNIINKFNIDLNEEIVICEIGTGYGRLANIFLQVMPKCHYVLVDLPESLFVAYYHLSKVFGNSIKKYEESRERKECPRDFFLEKKATFLLAQDFDKIKLKSVDLFINIDSFQEMTPQIVKDYFDKIIKHNGKFLYLKNSIDPGTNLIDTDNFKLEDYPKQLNMNILNTSLSAPYWNMVEQFIKLN
ncbi:MAG: putative sugar O-methyltransferase [Nanoarchaeota archaeon]|nr:putative sugar O-methyltransferase [Nanoarchaeota archaeon]MBU1632358.1 putative sugar O-methyltransferase [Nanoarchaeota archaeon]